MSDDPFFALRSRAYDLADSGRYKSWAQVASALQGESFPDALIFRLESDKLAVMLITRCCTQAQSH